MATRNILGNYNFSIEVNGLDTLYIQDVKCPELEVSERQWSAGNNLPMQKVPGGLTTGDMVLQQVLDTSNPSYWAWDQLALAASGVVTEFMQSGVLKERNDTGGVIRRFIFIDAFVKKVELNNKQTSDKQQNVIETITLSVRYFFPEQVTRFRNLISQ